MSARAPGRRARSPRSRAPRGAQGEGHLRLGRERRMAAREDQAEPVLRHGRVLLRRPRARDAARSPPASGRGACAGAAGRSPCAARSETSQVTGFGGAGRRPLLERRRERLLERLLGHVDVAEQPDQGGEDSPVLRAKDLLDAHGHPMSRYPTRRPHATRLPAAPLPMGRAAIAGTPPHQRARPDTWFPFTRAPTVGVKSTSRSISPLVSGTPAAGPASRDPSAWPRCWARSA